MNHIKNMLSVMMMSVLMLGLISLVPDAGAADRQEKVSAPDFTQGAKKPDTHDWTLGPTGARGWIYGWKGQTAEARQILVTAVAKGSPADGILNIGDVILGVGEQPFGSDARIQFANAITTAEQKDGGGVLRLIRWRAGKTEKVSLKISVMGTYSATAPYDCPKSSRIFELGCQAIAKQGLGGVSIPNNLNALALLASGKKEYATLLAEYAQKVASYKTDSFATWYYGYANMFLAEYYLVTGDQSVFPGVKRMAMEAAVGQSGVGTWGHKFARSDGNLNGYGSMNSPGLSLAVSMVLARQAGVKDPELDRAITKSVDFLRWYVNKGAIPYGDHDPWPGHEDNGKCSNAAVLYDLIGDSEATTFFAKMSTAAYAERERGHTGNFFNILWAMPGVSRCGPLATGAYWKEQAWYYDLARGPDGSFAYQGSPDGEEEHGKYTKWDSTGAYLLAYALPLKSLYLTGKQKCSIPALNATEAEEVIAAGRNYSSATKNNCYDGRNTEQLLAGLSSWSPAVRKRSAQALGRREGDFVPTLEKMLASTNSNARYGACEALANLGTKAAPMAPQLRALLNNSDPWLQSLACSALTTLGGQATKDSLPDMLNMANMSGKNNPADPRRMSQRAVGEALFAKMGNSLVDVDRKLLYPAVQSVLENEDGRTRGTLTKFYSQLTASDLAALMPAIIKAVEKMAPSGEMFADGIRLAGLDLLSQLYIREGMSLCVSVLELDRWGQGSRVPICREYLSRYGVHAKEILPQLQKLRDNFAKSDVKADKEAAKTLDEIMGNITSSKASPVILDLKEFMAHPTAVPKKKKS